MKKIIPYYILLMVLVACSKDSRQSDDKELPVIQLSSPSNNQVFSAGQTANITANITDNNKLALVHVHIYNNGTGQLVIDIHRSPAGSTYSLNESLQVQAGIEYKIQVVAIDNSANQQVQTVFISAN
jgi:hypothetical protein